MRSGSTPLPPPTPLPPLPPLPQPQPPPPSGHAAFFYGSPAGNLWTSDDTVLGPSSIGQTETAAAPWTSFSQRDAELVASRKASFWGQNEAENFDRRGPLQLQGQGPATTSNDRRNFSGLSLPFSSRTNFYRASPMFPRATATWNTERPIVDVPCSFFTVASVDPAASATTDQPTIARTTPPGGFFALPSELVERGCFAESGDSPSSWQTERDEPTHDRSRQLPKGWKYVCPLSACAQRFSRACDLRRHLQVHTGYRPHKCAWCGRFFSRKDHLKTHIRTHTGEKPFACETCLRRFARSDELRRHRNVHVKRTPKASATETPEKRKKKGKNKAPGSGSSGAVLPVQISSSSSTRSTPPSPPSPLYSLATSVNCF